MVYRVFKRQMNPVYDFGPIFIKINFSIILPSAPRSYLQLFTNRSLTEFLFCPTCNVHRPFRGTEHLQKHSFYIPGRFSLSSAWRWRQHVLPKRRSIVILLHGVITQRIIICATTAVNGRRIMGYWIKNQNFLLHRTQRSDIVFTTTDFILIAFFSFCYL